MTVRLGFVNNSSSSSFDGISDQIPIPTTFTCTHLIKTPEGEMWLFENEEACKKVANQLGCSYVSFEKQVGKSDNLCAFYKPDVYATCVNIAWHNDGTYRCPTSGVPSCKFHIRKCNRCHHEDVDGVCHRKESKRHGSTCNRMHCNLYINSVGEKVTIRNANCKWHKNDRCNNPNIFVHFDKSDGPCGFIHCNDAKIYCKGYKPSKQFQIRYGMMIELGKKYNSKEEAVAAMEKIRDSFSVDEVTD